MSITYGNNSAVLHLSAVNIWNLGQEFADPTGGIYREISVTHLAMLPEMLANGQYKDTPACGDIHKEAAW